MAEQRLLERLSAREQELRLQPRPEQRLARSVEEHLQRILNTRRGNVPADLEFGMPDLSHVAAGGGDPDIGGVERLVTDLIAGYEPRLTGARVNCRPAAKGRLGLDVEIAGTVTVAGGESRVRVEGRMGPDGWFEFNDN